MKASPADIRHERRFLTSQITDGRQMYPMPGCYGTAVLTWVKPASIPVFFLMSIDLQERRQ